MLVLINITYKEVKFRNTKNFQNEPVKGPSKQGSMDDVLILFLLFEVCPTLQKSLQHNYIFQYKTQNNIPDKAQTRTLKCRGTHPQYMELRQSRMDSHGSAFQCSYQHK